MTLISVAESPAAVNMAVLETNAETAPEPCPRCDGTGVIEVPTRYGAYWVPDTAPCPLCVAPPTDEPPF